MSQGLRTAISLRGITQTYENGVDALRGLDLEVQRGEFLSLLGPSGCGKSTALRIISGLMEPSAGQMTWPLEADERPGDEIGFVFQEPTLMPWANVFSNVWLPLRLKGHSKKEAQDSVMAALSLVGLAEFAKCRPQELSGGMKMRVSIARALVTRPKVLLMDEPFAALDEITRFKLNNDLLELWAQFGWTVVFVTHSVFESVYLSNRVVIMESRPGRVACEKRIDVPHPRGEAFRTSREYQVLCQDISAALQASIGDATIL